MISDYYEFNTTLERAPFIQLLTICAVGLPIWILAWRFWRFTLSPQLHPRNPKEIPYWTPGLGHALAFFHDMNCFLERSQKMFPGSSLPFAISVARQTFYVLRAPEDVSAVYKNTHDLTFESFVRNLMKAYGLSPSTVNKVFDKEATSTCSPSSALAKKSLVQRVSDLYKQQLLPGKNLEHLLTTFIGEIDHLLCWNSVSNLASMRVADGQIKTISLMDLCGHTLVKAGTTTLFGKQLEMSAPELVRDFFDFNAEGWKLLFQYPRLAAPRMFAAKARCIEAVERYLKLPVEQRQDASWLLRKVELEERATGLDIGDIATMHAMLFWVANSNAYKVAFWIVVQILFDTNLMHKVLNEVQEAFAEGNLDRECLTTQSPYLESIYLEVLRLANDASSIRMVERDVAISGLTLKKGNYVLIPYRLMHSQEESYGPQAASFDPYRFIQNSNLSNRADFRPFGGGISYCPGRFVAKQECLGFVAILLHRFELQVVDLHDGKRLAQRVPDLDHGTPYMGIVGPANSGDLIVSIRQRNA